jgi:hypothetical protein
MRATVLYSMISVIIITIMASCDKEHVANTAFDTDPYAVKVTAGVGGMISRTNPVTGDVTQFNTGDQVAISNGSQFINYTFKDNAWFPTIASEYLKWETNLMTFNAYYPTSLGTSTTAFAVPTDQSTTEKIQGADWMTCAVEKPKGVVDLTFARQMARVIIKIGSFGDQYAEDKQTVSNVIVNSITPFNQNGNGVNATFTALVKPTDADANATFVALTDGNGNPLTVKGIPVMAKGNSYTYTLRVGKDKVTIAEVTVSNWETGAIIGGESTVPTVNNSANDTDKAANTLGVALEGKFGADYATKIKTIKVTGTMNQADFTSLQTFEYIDLSEVDVVGEIDINHSEPKVQQGNAIPMNAFYNNTTLKEINLPHAITTIGTAAFSECKTLTGTLTIPAGVTVIGDYAFHATKFTGLAGFSEKLESIGKNVFNGCSQLKGTLIIPATVKEIVNDAFAGLSGMDVIEVSWTNDADILEIHDTPESTFGARTFPYTFWKEKDTKSITVPKGTLELYQAKTGWSFYNLTEKK